MKTETLILLENATQTVGLEVSPFIKASGYHSPGTSQSYLYTFSEFTGTISLEGTLLQRPADEDWATIPSTEFVASELTGSIVISESGIVATTIDDGETTVESIPFQPFASSIGNYVWVRAVYSVDSGTIDQIRFNF
jgi:hypothetical protein